MKNPTTTERKSEREIVVTRTVNAPARIVFDAWTKPEVFRRWWVPKSCGFTLLACEMDVRVGGSYRLTYDFGNGSSMDFFGSYTEVVPGSRLVWTNDEGDAGVTITTVTFTEREGQTLVVLSDLHPSKESLDAAIASAGGASCSEETLDQLDELLSTSP